MNYDITFLGHMCIDEIVPYGGEPHTAPGSAVLCGAMAAARAGARVAVVAKMAEADSSTLDPARDAGADVFIIPAPVTTCNRVVHPTPDVDVREMIMKCDAGFISLSEMPDIQTRFLHLAGISDREFTLELIGGLAGRGHSLSTDMQSFVRQVDTSTRRIDFCDVPAKREIVAQMDRLKLDVVEAKLLTGFDDIERAACEIESWGCPEIVITESGGVLARVNGETLFEPFSNRNISGRTGRGDTTFAAYMTRRLTHSPAPSLKFAAALVSIKMETPGPFCGTLDEVLARMQCEHGG